MEAYNSQNKHCNASKNRHQDSSVNTRVVPKASVLIFYLNVYWTHLKLQVISFKV